MTKVSEPLVLCLRRLHERSVTHPELTKIWTKYLTERIPSEKDITDCMTAIDTMTTLPDISAEQIQTLYNIGSWLCEKK